MKLSNEELVQLYRDMIEWRMQLISTFEYQKGDIESLKNDVARESNIGGKLIKIGTILIIIPIPIISEALGIFMVFIGIMLSRFVKIHSIRDIGYAFNIAASSAMKLREEILSETKLANMLNEV